MTKYFMAYVDCGMVERRWAISADSFDTAFGFISKMGYPDYALEEITAEQYFEFIETARKRRCQKWQIV